MKNRLDLPRAAALLAIGLLAVGAASAVAAPVAPPAPTRWVTDGAGFLSPAVRDTLDKRLQQYQAQTGHQILVWIGRSTGSEPLEYFTVNAFAEWRVGRKGFDDGLIIFLFANDRKIRFEVGYGLEGQIPDAIASRIIKDVMLPRLEGGDRDGAAVAGVDAVTALIAGEPWTAVFRQGAGNPAAGAAASQEEAPGQEETRAAAPERERVSPLRKVMFAIFGVILLIFLITHPWVALYLLVDIAVGAATGRGGGFSGGGGRSGGGGASGSW